MERAHRREAVPGSRRRTTASRWGGVLRSGASGTARTAHARGCSWAGAGGTHSLCSRRSSAWIHPSPGYSRDWGAPSNPRALGRAWTSNRRRYLLRRNCTDGALLPARRGAGFSPPHDWPARSLHQPYPAGFLRVRRAPPRQSGLVAQGMLNGAEQSLFLLACPLVRCFVFAQKTEKGV